MPKKTIKPSISKEAKKEGETPAYEAKEKQAVKIFDKMKKGKK